MGMEIFLVLVSLLVVGLLIVLIVLPIVAIARTGRIRELSERLWYLERDVRRLKRARAEEEAGAETAALPAAPVERALPAPPPLPAAISPEDLPLAEALPDEPGRRPEEPPRRPRRHEPAGREPARERSPTLADFEAWIGGRGLGWIAVILLLFTGAFFIKLAIEHGLLGELARVAIGLGIAVTLCVLGLRSHRRGRPIFSQMLTSAGIILLYLTTFASFGYYHLLPQRHAAIFLIAIIVETAALALYYEAPAIAIMAVVGGLLTPILLHTDRDQYVGLFTYLAVFNAGVVGLAFLRRWPAVASLALAGTQILFWGWYVQNYHPLKLSAAIVFQAVVFALYLGHAVVLHIVRGQRANPEDLARQLGNALFVAAAGYVLLDPDYHRWLGTAAVGMATLYAALAWAVITRRPDDPVLLLVLVAAALAFVAAAIPLQAEAVWIALAWGVVALALWWFALRIGATPLLAFAGFFFVLALGRLLLVDTLDAHQAPFVPLVNRYALPALMTAACFLAAAIAGRRFRAAAPDAVFVLSRVVGLVGVALVWVIFSVEAYEYFWVQIPYATSWTVADLRQSAQTALSIVWALLAVIMLAVGFRLPSRPLRWAALGLFAITLGKVILIDMARLPGWYRLAAFLVLSLVMLGAAWAYQKLKPILVAEEESPHETM
ncbi:MAG: DUF2339 domain-containing protein [Gemmataceae bacterium]